MSFEFRAGDKVKCVFFGDEVFELKTISGAEFYVLNFDRLGVLFAFTSDGRRRKDHTHPVLTLVERPLAQGPVSICSRCAKRMVKKEVKAWAVVDAVSTGCFMYKHHAQERLRSTPGNRHLVELTGSYEVEEE